MASVSTIWDYDTVTSGSPPATPVPTGSNYVSALVSNVTPYWLDLSTNNGGTPFFIVRPWSITPVDLETASQIWISVDKTYVNLSTSDNALLQNQRLQITLLESRPNATVQVLSQQTEIQGQTVNATIPAGSTIGIDGSVTLATGTQVTFTNANIGIDSMPNVNFAPGQSVNIGSVTETVNTSSNVTNEYISNNPLVYIGENTLSRTWNTGDKIPINIAGTRGLYDSIMLTMESSSGNILHYNVYPNGLYTNDFGYDIMVSSFSGNTYLGTIGYDSRGGNNAVAFQEFDFSPVICYLVQVSIEWNGTNGVSDTVTVKAYGRNTSTSSLSGLSYGSWSNSCGTGSWSTILDSTHAPSIKKLFVTLLNDGSGAQTNPCQIALSFNGSSQFAILGLSGTWNPNNFYPQTWEFDFLPGIDMVIGNKNISAQAFNLDANVIPYLEMLAIL